MQARRENGPGCVVFVLAPLHGGLTVACCSPGIRNQLPTQSRPWKLFGRAKPPFALLPEVRPRGGFGLCRFSHAVLRAFKLAASGNVDSWCILSHGSSRVRDSCHVAPYLDVPPARAGWRARAGRHAGPRRDCCPALARRRGTSAGDALCFRGPADVHGLERHRRLRAERAASADGPRRADVGPGLHGRRCTRRSSRRGARLPRPALRPRRSQGLADPRHARPLPRLAWRPVVRPRPGARHPARAETGPLPHRREERRLQVPARQPGPARVAASAPTNSAKCRRARCWSWLCRRGPRSCSTRPASIGKSVPVLEPRQAASSTATPPSRCAARRTTTSATAR